MLKLRDAMKTALTWIGGFSLILVAAVLFAQTVARYCFHYSFYWADELARFSMIWGALLCAAVGVSERSHTALDFAVRMLPPKARQAVAVLLDVVYMIFSVAMCYYSLANIRLGMKSASPGLGLPMGFVYLALPVSMACMLLFLALNLAEDVRLWMSGGESSPAKEG